MDNMMRVSSHIDGLMQGIGFRTEPVDGERETITFEVRPAADCVELHISHRVFKRNGKVVARYMLHSYAPAAFLALLEVLKSVELDQKSLEVYTKFLKPGEV